MADGDDEAARAFDALRAEVSLMRRAVERLAAERAEVVGQDPTHRASYDLVVSRSFGPPAVTIECAAPLLRVGGVFVVSEPPSTSVDQRWPTAGIAQLGCGPAVPVVVGDAPGYHFARIEQVDRSADRYPRRVGIPAKRPLFSADT